MWAHTELAFFRVYELCRVAGRGVCIIQRQEQPSPAWMGLAPCHCSCMTWVGQDRCCCASMPTGFMATSGGSWCEAVHNPCMPRPKHLPLRGSRLPAYPQALLLQGSFRCLAFDLPGHGRTPRPPAPAPDMAAQLYDNIQRLGLTGGWVGGWMRVAD